MKLKTNDRVLVVGATGTGKTYFAERLVRGLPRLIVVDPKSTLRGRWELEEWGRATQRALYRNEAVRARFSPAPGHEFEYETLFEHIYFAGNVVVYIDEVYGVVPPGRAPGAFFSAVYTRGRELGIGVIASTQRPAWIPLFVLSEAQTFVLFRLLLEKDKRRMAEVMGATALQDIPDPHGFFVYQTHWIASNRPAEYYRSVKA